MTPLNNLPGTCTLVIGMFSDLVPKSNIPGAGAGRFLETDLESFENLIHIAQSTILNCLSDLKPQQGGWESGGVRWGVGAFWWTARSVQEGKAGLGVDWVGMNATGVRTVQGVGGSERSGEFLNGSLPYAGAF